MDATQSDPAMIEMAEFIAKLVSDTFDGLREALRLQEQSVTDLAASASLPTAEFARAAISDRDVSLELSRLFPPEDPSHPSSVYAGAPYSPATSESSPERPPVRALTGIQLGQSDYSSAPVIQFAAEAFSIAPGGATLALAIPTPAAAGGLRVELSSSNPLSTAIPPNVDFAPGQTVLEIPIHGIAPGSATITATAPGLPPAKADITVASGLGFATAGANPQFGFIPAVAAMVPNSEQELQLVFSTPVASAAVVLLASSNAQAVTVPASVPIAAGATAASVRVRGAAEGSATITATVAGAPATITATASITVSKMALALVLPTELTVRLGQTLLLPLSLRTPAPAGISFGTTVTLATTDATRATVTPSVFVPGNATAPETQPQVFGIALGDAFIVASATGYTPARTRVTVTAAGSNAVFVPDALTVATGHTIDLTLRLPAPAPAGFVVTLGASTRSVNVPDTVTPDAGSTTVRVPVTGVEAGTAVISADAGVFGRASATVTVRLSSRFVLTQAGVDKIAAAIRSNLGAAVQASLRDSLARGIPRIVIDAGTLGVKLALQLQPAAGPVTSTPLSRKEARLLVRMVDDRAPQNQQLKVDILSNLEITFKTIT